MAIYKENYEKNYASFVVRSELSISSNLEFVRRGEHNKFCLHGFAGNQSHFFKTKFWL